MLNEIQSKSNHLTHWGRVTHICVGKLTIIGSDNGLSPQRRQAIIWTNAGILLIGPLGTNFSEILIEIQPFSLKKKRLKMSSAKCCSFRLDLNVLIRKFSCTYILSPGLLVLPCWKDESTHVDRDKMATIVQTTFSHLFGWMKVDVPWFKIHWNVFKGPVDNQSSLV